MCLLFGGKSGRVQVEDFAQQHLQLFKSSIVVEWAIKNRHLNELPSLAHDPNPTATIITSLVRMRIRHSFKPNREPHLRWTAPDDTAKILDTIIESYLNFLNETYKDVSDSTAALIVNAKYFER